MIASLSQKDLQLLQERNIDPALLDAYRQALVNGFPYIHLEAACEPGKDIKFFDESEISRLRNVYRSKTKLKVIKFVPASGAASRMFKELFTFIETGKSSPDVDNFFMRIKEYPFYKDLIECMKSAGESNPEGDKKALVEYLLLPKGLNYGMKPKGLIKFHRYPDGHSRTAFEEHFHEGYLYACKENTSVIHFTIPDTSGSEVVKHLEGLRDCLEKHHGISFHIETSIQKPSTDTPAIYTSDSQWVRDESGGLLLRPAGHGALLENLNELDADIVFVKNIDNVVPDGKKETTVVYKELLAGILIEVQGELFSYLRQLETGTLDRDSCSAFMKKWFNGNVEMLTDSEIAVMLNRPIRVCGMVKNEGEPGGGPFLVKEPDGSLTLQIVEKSQVDLSEAGQKELFEKSSHFNPVDIVLSLKDYTGRKFNLLQYRNDHTGMVVSKNYYGRDIKALELPGLWNGSMHYWNTIFVDVPVETFNPVKTVFDLLRPAHLTN